MAYTLRQIRYAVTVAEYGSISRASEFLNISQPAISSALSELEKGFNLAIFARSPARKILLTPAGRRFIGAARVLIERSNDFEANAMGLGHDVTGTIEVGCFTPTAPFMIPLVLTGLSENYPGIDIRLHEGDLDELNQWLVNGTIEVALTYDISLIREIRFEPLAEIHPHAVLSSTDPLAMSASVSLKDLAKRKMIGFDLPITRQFYVSLFANHNLQVETNYIAKSYEMVRSLVGAGRGFSIFMMRPEHQLTYGGNLLAHLPIIEDIPSPHYGLAFNAQTRLTRLTQTFAQECLRIFKLELRAESYFVRKPLKTLGMLV
jgi:DNA-binding transcriptional LysR family regulator